MDTGRFRELKSKVDKLTLKNKGLKEKQAVIKKENQVLKKALENNRKLLNNTPVPILVIQDEKVIITNKAFLEQSGYQEEDLLNKNFFDLFHPDYRDEAIRLHERRILGKSAPDHYETYLAGKPGTAFFCKILTRKIRYHGRRTFILNIIVLDKEMRREKKMILAKKMDAVIDMASVLKQDCHYCLDILDKQLSYIRGIEDPAGIQATRILKETEAVVNRFKLITGQLQSLSNLEYDAGKTVLFDLRKILVDALAAIRPEYKEVCKRPGREIHFNSFLRKLAPVKGHPDQIRGVFETIIANAIDTLTNGGEIYLTTEENSGFAYVYIQDNGRGIPDDAGKKIFEPFFTTKDGFAKGLGLSIANVVIERHGGKIEATSMKGSGSTFIVKLPLARKKGLSNNRPTKNMIKDSHILIIAREGIINDLLTRLFMSKGGIIINTNTVLKGLNLLKKKRFDLVITENNMLYSSLSNIIASIKKIDRDLPVALVNTEEKMKDYSHLKKMGADLIIEKPLNLDAISLSVSKILAARGGA